MGFERPVRLDASTQIALAESARHLSPGRWSAALLAQGYPAAEEVDILSLPLGMRDRLVMRIRANHVAGPMLAEPGCTSCGATFEITVEPQEVGLLGPTEPIDPGERDVAISAQTLSLRPVALSDLIAVEAIADPGAAAQAFAGRVCDADVDLTDLSEALEALDPAADIWLNTQCPECGAPHSFALDPVHFFAIELSQIAQRTLQDVVDIARVFHWSEADILALPEARRAFYVAEALA
ncbi:MAG: hypothetical protein AAGE61_12165 [Pseudomonadota bacterium]